MDTLFSHVSVVTMDDRMSVWTDAFVGVADGKIAWLSKKPPEEKPEKIIADQQTHVLPEEELPMNASGFETLDNIWDLFETTLRADSAYARTCLFEMAKWLEESQNLLDWIEKTPAEKQAWMEQVS